MLQSAWAAREDGATLTILGVEVSLNGGQQYTGSGQGLLLRESDLITSPLESQPAALDPKFGYVGGGTLLTLRYERAYSPSSLRARCLFRRVDPTDGSVHDHWMPFFALDEAAKYAKCFSPPAHLITAELENGGTVSVFLSTNGRDPSANSEPFLYRRTPKIASVDPEWLLAAKGWSIAVFGEAFFSPAPGAPAFAARFSSTSDPSRTRSVGVTFQAASDGEPDQLLLPWPAGAFAAGEQLRLEVSLDGGLNYHRAPKALTVYGEGQELLLARARPPVVYQWEAGKSASVIYAETITNLQDTEGLGRVRCRFGQAAAATQPTDARITICPGCDATSCTCTEAAFLNSTLVRCPLPNLATVGPVELRISVDGGTSYSTPAGAAPVRIVIRPPPAGTSLNATTRFETFDERVFIELQDPSWAPPAVLLVRIGGVTSPVQVENTVQPTGGPSSSAVTASVELPRGLAQGAYAVLASADGGTVFWPVENPPPPDPDDPTAPSSATGARRLL